jgi:hypothetical protein
MPANKTQPTSEQRARRILIDTYWSPRGWKDGSWQHDWAYQNTSLPDLEFAIQHGTMFARPDPTMLTYAAVSKQMDAALAERQPHEIGNLFLATLSSRNVLGRSVLGSYAYARHFPRHDANCSNPEHRYKAEFVDLNIYSFYRHMWGGNGSVTTGDPVYVAFDLQESLRTPAPSPSADDVAIFRDIIDVARALSPAAHVTHLEPVLAKVVRSNQNERRVLLEMLGIADIFNAPEHPGFTFGWVPPNQRPIPPGGRANDWAYPISWWRGGGVSDEALALYFPALF